MKERIHDRVHGRVHGIYFRLATRKEVQKQNVTGWVWNCRDGRVEALFEGERDAVKGMVAFCREGSPAALVERLEAVREEYTGEYHGLSILY